MASESSLYCLDVQVSRRRLYLLFSPAFWLFLLSTASCDDKAGRTKERDLDAVTTARSEPPKQQARLDASADLERETDPVGAAGDLKAEAAQFTTLEACALKHAPSDAFLTDAIESLGYDTLLRDACRTLEAIHKADVRSCAAIEANLMRSRCHATFAIALAKPEHCPLAIDGKGHDLLCIAISSRTPALCLTTETLDTRIQCEAALAGSKGNNKRCEALPKGAKARCERFAERMRGFIVESDLQTLTLPKTSLVLKVVGDANADAADSKSESETDLGREVARGVLLTEERGKFFTLQVGRALRAPGTLYVPSPTLRPRIAFTLSVAKASSTGLAKVEQLEIDVPGRASYVLSGSQCDCTAAVTEFGTGRAAPIEFRIEGALGTVPKAIKFDVQVKTFVRDVIQAEAR
jgi:hypothetical protein